MQLKVKDLKKLLEDKPDDLPVYFRRIAPITGNIEEVGGCELSQVSFFGCVDECVIIEPMSDD